MKLTGAGWDAWVVVQCTSFGNQTAYIRKNPSNCWQQELRQDKFQLKIKYRAEVKLILFYC